MELNNLQKNGTPYLEEYQYIPSVDINRSLNYVEAGVFFTFFLIKDKGIDKMISNFLTDVESKVLNECENRQLNKVEYEDNKLHYGCFNSLFKHYYSISLNANRDSFQEHKNWILETLISDIKKSKNIIDKYKLILDFKRGLFETLEFIHLIGGYEKILGEKIAQQKQLVRKNLEKIESRKQEKIEEEKIERVLLKRKLIEGENIGTPNKLKPGRKAVGILNLYAIKYNLIHLYNKDIKEEALISLGDFYKNTAKIEGLNPDSFSNAYKEFNCENDIKDYFKKKPIFFEEFKKRDLLKEYPSAKKFVDDLKIN